jgi:hypothetical protein
VTNPESPQTKIKEIYNGNGRELFQALPGLKYLGAGGHADIGCRI